MFTGIIHSTSRVTHVVPVTGGLLVTLRKPLGWKVRVGDSIAVNGVCSTVKKNGRAVAFEYMPESLRRTTIGDIKKQDVVNVEQSLRLADRVDGHLVHGHVDTVGTIQSLVSDGNSTIFTIVPRDKTILKFVATKGSIAVEGISLTVTAVTKASFSVNILPFTKKHTNLYAKQAGDKVNIEVDMLARYAGRLLRGA